MVKLEHKKYGSMGGEFILHHHTLQPKRLLLSLVVTTTLTAIFNLHEMDVMVMWVLCLLLAVALVVRLFNKVSKEVLLVLPTLGVQVKTQYWFGCQETQFFDKTHVKGIVINEAVTMQSVLCYLAVLLTSSPGGPVEHIYPLFTRSWPPLKDLVYVYQSVENMRTEGYKSSLRLDSKQEEQTEEVGGGDVTLPQTASHGRRLHRRRPDKVADGPTRQTRSRTS